jgi:hypothetical protein
MIIQSSYLQFDGPGEEGSNILAHAFLPNYQNKGTLNGDIHMDDFEQWNVNNSRKGVSLPHVLVGKRGREADSISKEWILIKIFPLFWAKFFSLIFAAITNIAFIINHIFTKIYCFRKKKLKNFVTKL